MTMMTSMPAIASVSCTSNTNWRIEIERSIVTLTSTEGGKCACDLVISDYAMPQLSGSDFLREVRKLCPGVPALLITGYAEKESLVDGLDEVEVLLKPFTPAALEAAIARVTDREEASA